MAKTAAFGIYSKEAQAAQALEALRAAGFRNSDVSVLISASPGDKDLVMDKSSKAPEGAVAGASLGALLGGAAGWLAAIGTLAIPGLGPLIAAGPILALLSGVGVGGTVGGLAGGLIGAGTPEYEAKRYEGRVKSGHVLVSVHCEDDQWLDSARQILTRTGAEDISSTGESSADDTETKHEKAVASGQSIADYERDFRRDFGTNRTDMGIPFESAAPIYEFGFRMARSQQFAGKKYEDVEPELKAAYLREFPEGEWDRVSNLVLYGWERGGGALKQGFVLI